MLRRVAVLVSGALAAGVSAVAGLLAIRGRRRRRREELRASRKAARASQPAVAPAAVEMASAPAPAPAPGEPETSPADAAGAPSVPAAGPEGPRGAAIDADLRTIRGIGAISAERLREAGVTTIGHIAAWSDDEVREIAMRIRVSPERIAREGWVAQARELVGATTGD